MQIKINIQIFAMIIVLILTNQIEIYAWLMLFTAIHEAAHAIAGLALKLKPKTLKIEPFGIGIVYESFENTDKNKIIIALAGPVTNLIISVIFYFIQTKHQNIIINTNLILALFNLIPIYPLDGGRILKSILRTKKDKEKAEKIVNKISNILMIIITVICSIFILIYKNIGIFLIGIYLWIIVMKENRRYILKRRISKLLENEKNA